MTAAHAPGFLGRRLARYAAVVAEALLQLGHDPQAIRTERFGPTGD
jgi:hypothetical protein